jgi:hypothetical protein
MKNVHPALRPVSPNECALAVAIPLTREQFLVDLSTSEERDFVHHFRDERGLQRASAEFSWEVYEENEGTFAETVCSEVERLGVTVRRNAKLADLSDLLSRFQVVTLVAHLRFVPIKPEDIADPMRLLELLQSNQSSVHESMKEAFEQADPDLLQSKVARHLRDEELRSRVAQVINGVANMAQDRYSGRAESVELRTHDGFDKSITRMEFEQMFPDCIIPASVIEFRDGMYTVREFLCAIPETFDGLLDLTVCNSVLPAGLIRRKRPSCLVVANRLPAELRARMYLYGLQISLLGKRSVSFVEVIQQVHTGKSAYGTRGGRLWNLFGRFFKNTQDRP